MMVKDQPELIPTFTSDIKLDCTKEFQSSQTNLQILCRIVIMSSSCYSSINIVMICSRGGNGPWPQWPLHNPTRPLNFLAQNCIRLEPSPFTARALRFSSSKSWALYHPYMHLYLKAIRRYRQKELKIPVVIPVPCELQIRL